jgi:ankyrin repeat protein
VVTRSPDLSECLGALLKTNTMDINAKDRDGQTPLFVAVLNGTTAIAAEASSRSTCPPLGSMACVRRLLKRGADPNEPNPYGRGPIHAAVKNGERGFAARDLVPRDAPLFAAQAALISFASSSRTRPLTSMPRTRPDRHRSSLPSTGVHCLAARRLFFPSHDWLSRG